MARVSPRLIKIKVSGTDRSIEVSKAVIQSAKAESDFTTFADAAAGGARDYTLNMVCAQDHAVSTLWDLIWSSAGTDVACTYMPYGNTTPSTTQPHYTFTATVKEPEGDFLGAEANESTTAVATIEVNWPLTGKPTKVTV